MRARLLVLGLVIALAACGSERAAPPPEPAAAAPSAAERRPGEEAILARWRAAQAEVERHGREQARLRDEPIAEGADRRVHLRRALELDHQLALATLRRDEAEIDFYANACPEAAGSIAEGYHRAAEEERTARGAWLEARLASMDADVTLTDLTEDEDADDDAIDRATERADAATARDGALEETVSESSDRRFDLRLEARDACDARLPT